MQQPEISASPGLNHQHFSSISFSLSELLDISIVLLPSGKSANRTKYKQTSYKHHTCDTAAPSASGVLGCTTLPIVVAADPRALSSVTSVAASHSRDCRWLRPDRERLCSRGALDGDVISLLLGIAPSLLKAPILSSYATGTGGGDAGEREAAATIRESFGPL